MQSQRTFNRKDKEIMNDLLIVSDDERDEERDRVEEAIKIVLIAMTISLIAGASLAFGAYLILSF